MFILKSKSLFNTHSGLEAVILHNAVMESDVLFYSGDREELIK